LRSGYLLLERNADRADFEFVIKKLGSVSVFSLMENTLNYDCPCGQVMSYGMLRIVMVGFAKWKIARAIIS
jgi:hypothetical protein